MRRNVISNYHGARKCGFGAKPGPKRTSCSGRAQQGLVRGAITGSVITPSSCTIFLGGRLQVPWKLTSGARRGYLQRDCYAQLYCIPRRTRAGILDAQLGSKAYLGVQNHTPLDRDRRTKVHRKMQCHHHTQNQQKRMTRGRHPNASDGHKEDGNPRHSTRQE